MTLPPETVPETVTETVPETVPETITDSADTIIPLYQTSIAIHLLIAVIALFLVFNSPRVGC